MLWFLVGLGVCFVFCKTKAQLENWFFISAIDYNITFAVLNAYFVFPTEDQINNTTDILYTEQFHSCKYLLYCFLKVEYLEAVFPFVCPLKLLYFPVL